MAEEADNLARLVKQKGHAEAMYQAAQVISALTKQLGVWGTPEAQGLIHYFSEQVYKSDYHFKLPSASGEQTPLRKVSDSQLPFTLRYAVSPAGQRGEFVRVAFVRSPSTNLVYCTSPDAKGLMVTKQQLGDALAELPGAISKLYGGAHVERCDWPE